MTNPAGFANVRAHAEAHLGAMTTASGPNPASTIGALEAAPRLRVPPPPAPAELHTSSTTVRAPREFSVRADEEREGPGDHWVTIDGHHVLIHEPQGKENQETPQSLTARIPCHIKAAISASIRASNSHTADDNKGGFHEEGGQWIITDDGKSIPVPAKPGPANPTIKEGGAHIHPSDAIDPSLKERNFNLGGTWHVHPSGELTEQVGNVRNTTNFKQPPSQKDIKEAGPGINIVVGARDKKVYFYDSSGPIDKPMKLHDFLKGC